MSHYRVPTSAGGVLRAAARALFDAYCARYISGGMAAWARTMAAR